MRVEVDLDVVEEARVPELAHVARQPLGRERLAHVFAQVGEEVVLRNAAVADHFDPPNGLVLGELGFGGRQRQRLRDHIFGYRGAKPGLVRRAAVATFRSGRRVERLGAAVGVAGCHDDRAGIGPVTRTSACVLCARVLREGHERNAHRQRATHPR